MRGLVTHGPGTRPARGGLLARMLGVALALALTLACGPSQAAEAPAADTGPLPGVTMQVISYPSDPPGPPRRAPGGGRILSPAVLYTPVAGANTQAPAIVMLDQGPGAHPLELSQATRYAGERLAAQGYTVLSLYAGQERGFARMPFADVVHAIRGALDYLEVSGHERFVLLGQGYGAIAAAQYLASEPDTLMDNGGEKRVKALLLINPLTELRHYPRADLLQGYEARVAQAQASVAAGRGGIPQLEPGRNVGQAYDPWLLAGPFIAPASNFLDYWGPAAAQRNDALLQQLALPTWVAVAGQDPSVSMTRLQALRPAAAWQLHAYPQADAAFSGQQAQLVADIGRWLAQQHLTVPPRVSTRVLDTATAGGRVLQAVQYLPALPEGQPGSAPGEQPLLMLIGGRTADTVQSSTHWMGVRLAAQGIPVWAPGLRVSGVAGFQSSTHAEAAEDIGRWIDRAAALGHRRIVLAGHSNGGIWISNYLSLTQDPRVVGMVYFAPTRDTIPFAQAEEGAAYATNLATARAAVARGDGLRQVIGLLTAQAWLDNNGPDSRGLHTQRITEFKRPGLVIAGGRDPLMSAGFLAQFQRQYQGPLTVLRYPEGSHGLRESKPQLGDDVARWITQTLR